MRDRKQQTRYSSAWRAKVSEERRQDLVNRLNGGTWRCETCGLVDEVAVRVKAKPSAICLVQDLWRKSQENYEQATRNPHQDWELLCRACERVRIFESHPHGSPSRSRKCSCDVCREYTRVRLRNYRNERRARRRVA